ncbi:hypothetical protein B0T26DRAFT_875346 [Lasiosphaeria miniovina]|uniref:Uncharacterized protein n=1 Tax=Lasiosphaeria miniovina TaxID=1954250 RepID=A0AA39ZYR4_9PEZI|nr:uncharacterized protein B0T26DRAFT_875346 [Lasiosphaeria miniovina]KAK0706090.1 hypothetical protein B0T26DRAFT_875346 [Lasiosphaeria miniovina]
MVEAFPTGSTSPVTAHARPDPPTRLEDLVFQGFDTIQQHMCIMNVNIRDVFTKATCGKALDPSYNAFYGTDSLDISLVSFNPTVSPTPYDEVPFHDVLPRRPAASLRVLERLLLRLVDTCCIDKSSSAELSDHSMVGTADATRIDTEPYGSTATTSKPPPDPEKTLSLILGTHQSIEISDVFPRDAVTNGNEVLLTSLKGKNNWVMKLTTADSSGDSSPDDNLPQKPLVETFQT